MSRSVFGAILVLIGAAVIFNRVAFSLSPFHLLWPMWLLVPGLALQVAFFVRPRPNRSNMLMPAGILTVLGIVFFLERIPVLDRLVTWPQVMLAPAAGFLEMYFFGHREFRYFVSGAVLVIIAVVAYVNLFLMLNGALLIGAAFVIIGLYVILRPVLKSERKR